MTAIAMLSLLKEQVGSVMPTGEVIYFGGG